ncbi:MAG: hypothetical protein LIO77_06875 [Rikenellaceae bacterium]|nr:hypothetical protein [Rikenellaceae bacterium]
MYKLKRFLIGTGIVALILFIIVLVVGFHIASALLVVAFYIVGFIFLIILGIYLYRKAKNRLGNSDGNRPVR